MQEGFISLRTLVVVVIILVILGLLGVSVQHDIVENPGVQENTSYVTSGVVYVWNNYLYGPAHFLWQDVFVNLIWQSFVVNMQNLQNGGTPTNFELQGDLPYPTIPELINNYNTNHP